MKTRFTSLIAALAAAAFCLASNAAHAQLLTTESEAAWQASVSSPTLVTFDDLADGTAVTNQYAGVTVSPLNGGSPMAQAVSSPYSGPNVLAVDNLQLGQGGGATFSFTSPQVGVSLWYNDSQFAGNTITVYGTANQVLGSFEMEYPHPTVWLFVGFTSSAANISKVAVSMGDDDRVPLDNLQFSPMAAVPEPASAVLWVIGMAALGVARRTTRSSLPARQPSAN